MLLQKWIQTIAQFKVNILCIVHGYSIVHERNSIDGIPLSTKSGMTVKIIEQPYPISTDQPVETIPVISLKKKCAS